MKRYVLFDLDGTLTDSKHGIYNSIEYSLRYFGITVDDRESLRPWLGPPLTDSMKQYYGFDQAQAELGVEKYREYYNDKGIFENQVYPGIMEMLEQLKRMGMKIYMATSKPEPAAVKIAEHFGFDGYFDYIGGASYDDSRSAKADVVRYVLRTAGITDLSAAVMIGDRRHDIVGAKENGLESIGVLYGYGDEEELKNAGADWLAADPAEICQILSRKF